MWWSVGRFVRRRRRIDRPQNPINDRVEVMYKKSLFSSGGLGIRVVLVVIGHRWLALWPSHSILIVNVEWWCVRPRVVSLASNSLSRCVFSAMIFIHVFHSYFSLASFLPYTLISSSIIQRNEAIQSMWHSALQWPVRSFSPLSSHSRMSLG
jgi:hypothetical protein